MNRLFQVVAVSIICGSALYSCKPDIDKSDPVFENLTINEMSEDTIFVEAGESLSAVADVYDDEEINQLRFSFDFTGSTYYYPSRFPEQVEVIVLGQKEYQYSNSIFIPDTVPHSTWRVSFRALDDTGNEAEAERVVHIVNNFLPEIQLIDSLMENFSGGNFSVQQGDTLELHGSVADDDLLDLFRLEMRTMEDSTLFWTFEETLNTQVAELQNLSGLITLPADTTGSYDLYLIARDAEGYVGRKRFPISISE